jgi:hypothetical protein
MFVDDLHIDRKRLAAVCAKHHVAKLEVFGSFVRGDAQSGSDLDILVTFRTGARDGLEIVALQQELEVILGRSVDLLTRSSVERSANKYFRRFATRRTEPIYERV